MISVEDILGQLANTIGPSLSKGASVPKMSKQANPVQSQQPQIPQQESPQPQVQTQAPKQAQPQKPEDQMQRMMQMLGAIQGIIPKVNVPQKRTAADYIQALAPISAGVVGALTGPRYRRTRNLVAGIAGGAPEAAVQFLTAPRQRALAQQEANAGQFKMATDVLRAMAPMLRPEGMVVGQDASGNPIYIPRDQAAGQPVGARPTASRQPKTEDVFVNGKPVNVYFDDKQHKWFDTASGNQVSGFTKVQGQVRPAEWGQDDNDNWFHLWRDQQGNIVKVDFDNGQGGRLEPPPGYETKITTRQQVVPVQHEDGSIDYTIVNLSSRTTPQTSKGNRAGSSTGEQLFMVPGPKPKGLISPGNIDIAHRPNVYNPETKNNSSVWSMSIGTDQGEVLIPRVSDDGKILSKDEAIEQYRRTRKNLGVFDNPEDATAYAEKLHKQQEAQGRKPAAKTGGGTSTPRIFATGGKKDTEQEKAQITDLAKASIDVAERMGKGVPNDKKREAALADWNAIVEGARQDPDNPHAKRILAISPNVESQIRQRYPMPQTGGMALPAGAPQPPTEEPNYRTP